jgi:hypothetical protein
MEAIPSCGVSLPVRCCSKERNKNNKLADLDQKETQKTGRIARQHLMEHPVY